MSPGFAVISAADCAAGIGGDSAPNRIAAVNRIGDSEQLRAHAGADSIGSDDGIVLLDAAVSEMNPDSGFDCSRCVNSRPRRMCSGGTAERSDASRSDRRVQSAGTSNFPKAMFMRTLPQLARTRK